MERIRAVYGLSRQIADVLGLSPSTVSEWRRVPAHHVQRVAEITGLAPEVLRPDVFRRSGNGKHSVQS